MDGGRGTGRGRGEISKQSRRGREGGGGKVRTGGEERG